MVIELPSKVFVDFHLYDCLGNTVEVLAHEVQEPGAHYIQVSSTNLASGITFIDWSQEMYPSQSE